MPGERLQRRIDSLLDEADTALASNDWQTVLARAEAVLAADPGNADAVEYRATAQRGMAAAASADQDRPGQGAKSAEAPPHPESFGNGRYTVKRFLGEGGKKKVYLAHDNTLDRDIAFALIKSEGLDETSRERITREAQAMGRLGDHPNIVPIFDLGQETDPDTGISQPFMVLPLMTGGDVEGVIEKAPDHRMPLDRAIQIARDTCEGLVFAHSKGIVHRDLKPGNVWLSEDGRARIGDLGLAVATDRSRLTREGMMVGTPSYMPPEQAMGGQITPRADLYSLGAMLYEMVTGRPPFLGDDDIAVIGQHINTPPVAPAWHRPDCPKPLDALIMRLLAKDPAQRPESASDVLSALSAIDLTPGIAPLPPAQVPRGPGEASQEGSLDSLAGGVFVGRRKEMENLRAVLEQTLSGKGRLVMLAGEAGIGKTRITAELATYAGLRGCQILTGRSYETRGAPAYWPWVQAVRSYVRSEDPEKLRRSMGSGAAEIARVVSDVKERLPDLASRSRSDSADESSPDEARFRLFDAITAFLRAASLGRPIVLVLDDLHWADRPSLQLLAFVTRELEGARLLIVGTYRDVELSRQHPLAETLGDLNRERLFERIHLRGLSADDVARFIEMTSGFAPPAELAATVHRATEGNPLFVTEVVRLLVQEGELSRAASRDDAQSGHWTVRIPDGVLEVIGRRLNRLSAECNEALSVASVIGREFTLTQLSEVMEGASEDSTLALLEEALAARIVEELPSTPGRFQFAHNLIRETLANEISATRRVRLHARIAEVLEQQYGPEAPAHARELARHFEAAQALLGTDRLATYLLLSGGRASANYAWDEALEDLEHALLIKDGKRVDDGPLDEETRAILHSMARVQGARADDPRSRRASSAAARRLFDDLKAHGETRRAVELACQEFALSEDLIREALAMVEPDSIEQGRLLARRGLFDGFSGNLDMADEAFEAAAAIAQRDGDSALELSVLTNSVNIDNNALRWGEQTLARARKAADLAQTADDPYLEARGRYLAANQAFIIGDIELARQEASRIATLASLVRVRWMAGMDAQFRAELAAAVGDWGQARQALAEWKSHADQSHALSALPPTVAAQTGDLEGALQLVAGLRSHLEDRPKFASRQLVRVWAHIVMANEVSPIEPAVHRAVEILRTAGYFAPVEGSQPVAPLDRLGALHALPFIPSVELTDAEMTEIVKLLNSARPFHQAGLHISRSLAAAYRRMGRAGPMMEAIDEAIGFTSKAGYEVELAWSLFDKAVLVTERGQAGDADTASGLFDECLALAQKLKMAPLARRLVARRRILKA